MVHILAGIYVSLVCLLGTYMFSFCGKDISLRHFVNFSKKITKHISLHKCTCCFWLTTCKKNLPVPTHKIFKFAYNKGPTLQKKLWSGIRTYVSDTFLENLT